MEFKSPPPCPNTVTVRRNPPRRAKNTPATIPNTNLVSTTTTTTTFQSHVVQHNDITKFPLDEILQCEVTHNPNPIESSSLLKPPPSSLSPENPSENLRVFLRVRPISSNLTSRKKADGLSNIRTKSKGVGIPKREAKTKITTTSTTDQVCLSINDGSRSVTLSPPLAMQDSKRLKAEVYDGFTHVFQPESIQREVYEKVMEPLVSDFIKGKSGMVAAMGPTGSGKTHTIFGSPREPGLVPLAIRKMFNHTDNDGLSEQKRKFFISMFEIHSERGKGEKILDLSSDGTDVILQQSIIKGLQEVMVSSVVEAEAVIARGLLKRATAMTNSNSQSSRSQCIINFRGASKIIDRELDVVPNNPVLSIVDLAGAEREKKTGNQGTRLMESNFINNTSMVFGLCLRSLLEHQKNPKKPLQKHFQSSLLTRYLREHLEGKKRMTLILTVKPGGDDYLDTSFLLRQASPYMKIKFSTVEEPYQKRQMSKLSQGQQLKRRKLIAMDNPVIGEGKRIRDGHPIVEKEMITEPLQQLNHVSSPMSSPRLVEVEVNENLQLEEYSHLLARMKRKDQVLQSFSKALWNVLKQYKKKLEESENEVCSLKGILEGKDVQYAKLEKELADLKAHSSYCTQHSIESLESVSEMEGDPICLNEEIKESIPSADITGGTLRPSESVATCSEQLVLIADENYSLVAQSSLHGEDKMTSSALSMPLHDEQEFTAVCNPRESELEHACESSKYEMQCRRELPASSPSSKEINHLELDIENVKPKVSPGEEEGYANAHNICKSEPDHASLCKSLNEKKPRRRLLPASSILLKEINEFDFEVGNEKTRERRGGKKLPLEGKTLTMGSDSLLKLLKNNLHI